MDVKGIVFSRQAQLIAMAIVLIMFLIFGIKVLFEFRKAADQFNNFDTVDKYCKAYYSTDFENIDKNKININEIETAYSGLRKYSANLNITQFP